MSASPAGQQRFATPSYARLNAVVVTSAVTWVMVTALEAIQVSSDAGIAALWIGALIGPVLLVATCFGGLLAWLLEPESPWGLPRWFESNPESARRAVSLAVISWSLVLAALVFGGAGVALLVDSNGGRAARAAFGGLVLLAGAACVPAAWWVRSALSRRGSVRHGLLAAMVAAAVAILLVVTGETSGGGGSLGMWGVFRREELHLSLPAYLLLALVMGYQLPLWLLRAPRWASVLVLALFAAAGLMGRRLPMEIAFSLERETHLAGPALRQYQRLADSDGDGFAGAFGGGDCDDNAPQVNPAALDVPGNGVDEDCSGTDASDRKIDPEGKPEASTASSAVVAPPEPSVASAAAPENLNVLFVTIDTLRYDLGYAGNPRPVSPNIDALAQRSTVYDKAYALASYTSKSLGPLLIGRYGSETHRGWMHFNKYPPEDRMVQERLKEAGIATLSVQGHWYFKADTGLGRGFDVLDMSAAPTRPQGEGDKTVNSAQISDAAIGLLKEPEREKQRFFMWVHYLDPHAEYVPHPEFDFGSSGRARYDGEVAFTDFHVGRLLDALRNSALAERTIVIVTSDHGEAFNEHGLIRHGFELWEEVVRVPFVVYVPGQAPRHVEQRRSAIDIVPTILEVFGVPAPQGDDALSGQSMLGEWFGKAPEPRPVFIDMPAGPYNGDRQAYIVDDLKLTTSNSRPMGLFDLEKDPGETNNLAKDPALAGPALERMKEFRSKLRVVQVKPR